MLANPDSPPPFFPENEGIRLHPQARKKTRAPSLQARRQPACFSIPHSRTGSSIVKALQAQALSTGADNFNGLDDIAIPDQMNLRVGFSRLSGNQNPGGFV